MCLIKDHTIKVYPR